ncbi:MAG: hypothetical protein KA163_07620 [Bacteroidia bacterium]|nr:hypothetical protein [Bacteroidia bacterium]
MNKFKKVFAVYAACLLLTILIAYADRNDSPGYYAAHGLGTVVSELLTMSFVLFLVYSFFYGIVKLIWIGIKKIQFILDFIAFLKGDI